MSDYFRFWRLGAYIYLSVYQDGRQPGTASEALDFENMDRADGPVIHSKI